MHASSSKCERRVRWAVPGEAAASLGAGDHVDPDAAVGAVLRPCALCSHPHLRGGSEGRRVVLYVGACAICLDGCAVSWDEYHGRHYDDDYINVDDSPTDYHHIGFHRPDCRPGCDLMGHRDGPRAERMDPRRGVRGGWLGWFQWHGLSRLAGDQRDELGSERRVEPAAGSGPRDAGLADHGGRADSVVSTGPGRLRGLVMTGRRWL